MLTLHLHDPSAIGNAKNMPEAESPGLHSAAMFSGQDGSLKALRHTPKGMRHISGSISNRMNSGPRDLAPPGGHGKIIRIDKNSISQ
jgi:hypothetical protein